MNEYKWNSEAFNSMKGIYMIDTEVKVGLNRGTCLLGGSIPIIAEHKKKLQAIIIIGLGFHFLNSSSNHFYKSVAFDFPF